MEFQQRLSPFARRVRFVRAWRGLAVGAVFGAGGAAVLAALDYANVRYTEWWEMGALFGVAALVGAIVGAALPVKKDALAKSIDRRAGLRDRLETAMAGGDTSMEEAQQEDATAKFGEVKPSQVFPFRRSRWQAGALAGAVAASAIFLLGNSPILLNSQAKAAAEQNKVDAAKVERVLRETYEEAVSKRELAPDERKLVNEAIRLKKELDKGRINREDALQKANELIDKADKLTRESAKEELKSLDTAEKALEKAQQSELEKAGLQNADPNLMKLSPQELDAAKAMNKAKQEAAKKALDQANAQIAALQQKLQKPNLSEAERKKLEKELEEARKAAEQAGLDLKKAQAEGESLKLSEEAMKVLEKMQNSPLFKELQALAAKMKASSQQGAKSGRSPMTKAEREAAMKKLEEFLAKLKDDKEMEAYLKALIEAMKKGAGQCDGTGFCMGMGPGKPGPGSAMHGGAFSNTEFVYKLPKGVKGAGKATPTMVMGSQRLVGEETFVEIKAPTTVGTRSSIPYMKALPSYKQKAEEAMRDDKIPKEHEKRVKAYFEGLGK